MLIVAIVFVLCALSNPQLGHVIYIGNLEFGAKQWRVCYLVYVIVMAALFIASFFVKKKR
jgi:hypothetical protein